MTEATDKDQVEGLTFMEYCKYHEIPATQVVEDWAAFFLHEKAKVKELYAEALKYAEDRGNRLPKNPPGPILDIKVALNCIHGQTKVKRTRRKFLEAIYENFRWLDGWTYECCKKHNKAAMEAEIKMILEQKEKQKIEDRAKRKEEQKLEAKQKRLEDKQKRLAEKREIVILANQPEPEELELEQEPVKRDESWGDSRLNLIRANKPKVKALGGPSCEEVMGGLQANPTVNALVQELGDHDVDVGKEISCFLHKLRSSQIAQDL